MNMISKRGDPQKESIKPCKRGPHFTRKLAAIFFVQPLMKEGVLTIWSCCFLLLIPTSLKNNLEQKWINTMSSAWTSLKTEPPRIEVSFQMIFRQQLGDVPTSNRKTQPWWHLVVLGTVAFCPVCSYHFLQIHVESSAQLTKTLPQITPQKTNEWHDNGKKKQWMKMYSLSPN